MRPDVYDYLVESANRRGVSISAQASTVLSNRLEGQLFARRLKAETITRAESGSLADDAYHDWLATTRKIATDLQLELSFEIQFLERCISMISELTHEHQERTSEVSEALQNTAERIAEAIRDQPVLEFEEEAPTAAGGAA